MSPTASKLTINRMQPRFNVLTDIYKVFLLLLHCCILLEIKLTIIATAAITSTATAATASTATTTTTTTTTTMYTAEHYGICILT